MFEWATETNTPILNVHDSFACRKKDEERVSEAMYAKREKVVSGVFTELLLRTT